MRCFADWRARPRPRRRGRSRTRALRCTQASPLAEVERLPVLRREHSLLQPSHRAPHRRQHRHSGALGHHSGCSRHAELGASTWCAVAANPARKTESECLHRIVQRTSARRMPERTLVCQPGSRQDDHRNLATGIQPRTTQEISWRTHPRRLCPATRRGKHGMINNRTLIQTATQSGEQSHRTLRDKAAQHR